MAPVVDSVASAVERLSQQVCQLERRVAALEGQPEKPIPATESPDFALQLLWVIPALLAGVAAAAPAVVAFVWLAAGRLELTASRLSVVRTIVNCALALSLGFLGSRGKHVELGWVALPQSPSALSSFCSKTCASAMLCRWSSRFCSMAWF
jgi:hypothetical protein